MNQRIKELAEQAGLRFTQLMSNPMVPVVDGKETDLEKFAELIVQECAGICDERARSAPIGSDEQCEADDCSNSIKKYFGVQE